jgi:c-di-GMP-binding flagellar brake protein YcgR
MDLEVGQRLEMAFEGLKCWTSLRGWVPDKVLFVDLPQGARGRNLIRKGMACQIQFVMPDGILQFRSQVEELVLNEPPLMYLRYPRETRSQRLRSELRAKAHFRAVIRPPQGPAIHATVLNLSRGGCLVEADVRGLAIGSQVSFGAILAAHLLLVGVPCTVRRVEPSSRMGLAFGTLTEAQERALEQFLRRVAHPESPDTGNEGARRGMVGSLAAVSLLDTSQLVIASGRGYLLDVWDEPRSGRLCFDRGLLLHASVGALRGTSAFLEMLRWKKGQFFLSAVGDLPHRNVFCEWEDVMQQAAALV